MNGTEGLAERVARGGVYYNIEGENPVAVLRNMVQNIALPELVEREALLQAVLERETLSCTSIGDGIAIPHPRNPMLKDVSEERVAVCFPRHPVSYAALDHRPVFVLFLILSSGTKTHLYTLSELSFLCHQPEFRAFLAEKPSRALLAERIAKEEAVWKRGAQST
jgi:nitrogen PTS system EIIA component